MRLPWVRPYGRPVIRNQYRFGYLPSSRLPWKNGGDINKLTYQFIENYNPEAIASLTVDSALCCDKVLPCCNYPDKLNLSI
jgi:hypothetical protein